MTLARILPIEPYICVNDGFGEAHSAAEQVEYFNGAATTPMGKLRAANGHPEPYKVKWWNIGNEMYGPWQLGHMSLAHYAIKQNMFAEAMRAALDVLDAIEALETADAPPPPATTTDAEVATNGATTNGGDSAPLPAGQPSVAETLAPASSFESASRQNSLGSKLST